MNRQRLIHKKFTIPIYDAEFYLVVTDHIQQERKKYERYFGPVPDRDDYDALCSFSGGHRFALFLKRDVLNIKILAHEIFHLTHRILDWVSANFDKEHHEQGALLQGYLMDLVFHEIWPKGK